ncbi:MAG: DUF1080 domain-containing protein [Planctomycetota bacterium]|nr:DUF1080 domain-containing protein [Planctomycetota bacterium]
MRRPPLVRIALLFATLSLPTLTGAVADDEPKPVTPTETIVLFNGKDLSPFYTFTKETGHADPLRVFTVVDNIDGTPAIRISGEGSFGGLITKQAFTNYRLVAEFRWGDLTWGGRKKAARDSGILLHCFGPDGGYNKTWHASIECQIIEGGVGDFLAVPGATEDGRMFIPTLTAEVELDKDKEPCWKAGGMKKTITSGRINWYGRDPDWKDELNYRGPQDVESPHREWTRVEIICDGNTITNIVNGKVVNKAFDCSPQAGKITFQTEGAEIYFRKIELHPLK